MKILVTGAAGFIGSAVCRRLVTEGHEVLGLDCLSPYYDPALKQARVDQLSARSGFSFFRVDLTREGALLDVMHRTAPRRVIHLAAQPSARHSVGDPQSCIDQNVGGFLKVLEACRHFPVEHLIYASSSSVYGAGSGQPFTEGERAERPLSLYAATKRANELMAHAYQHLYQIPLTGLRFFTVYGPWGRPDMVPYKFCLNLLRREPIAVYNQGHHQRDFTFIDDIAEGVARVALAPAPDAAGGPRLYNLGRGRPEPLEKVISLLEAALGDKFARLDLPAQAGDVPETFADGTRLQRDFGFAPQTTLEAGLAAFVIWFKAYHREALR